MAEPNLRPPARVTSPWLGSAGVTLFALLVLLVHLELTVRRSDRPLLTYDSAEYAVAGRHLSRTGTLATWFVHPDELTRPTKPPFPLIVGHPLVPMLDAAVFAVGGPRPALTLIPAGLAYLLLVGFAAALGRRLGGSPGLGFAAGAAVALSPPVLHFASEGLTEIPFAAAAMAVLILLWDMPRRPRPLALGLVLGIAHLTRPVMVPLLPAWLLGVALAANAGSRLRALAMVLGGFLVCALPLALYKLVAAGNPLADVAKYNLLTWLAPDFTPERIHRMVHPPPPLPYLAAHLDAVWAKLVHFGPAMIWGAASQGGIAIGLLAALYLVSSGRDRESTAVRITWIALAVTFVSLVTLSLPSSRYLFPLLPTWIVFGVAAARPWLRTASAGVTALALTALVALGPGLGTLRLWSRALPAGVSDRGGFAESDWRTLGAEVAKRLPAHAIVASDIGPQFAWYTEHATVLIPNSPEELRDLEPYLAIDALVVTNHWLIGTPGSEEWRALFFARRSLAGWSRVDSVAAGGLRAVLFERAR